MKRIFCPIVITLLIMSCSPYPQEVEEALLLSGKNRCELEKVLQHFKSKGKQPYNAACFLISNMQYHQNKEEIILDSSYHHHFKKTDSLYEAIFSHLSIPKTRIANLRKYDSIVYTLSEQFDQLPKITNKICSKNDLQHLNADYLIDNIESAFSAWRNIPQLKSLSFEDFKEFILPYRTTNECATLYKRTELQRIFKDRIVKENACSTTEVLKWYKIYTAKCRWLNNKSKNKLSTGSFYDFLLWKKGWDCHNTASWTCDILRACGIPTVYEFTPKWIDRDTRHFWCCSPDSTGIFQPYTAPENNLREDWNTNIQFAGKVFRKTFGAQKNTPYFLADEDEFIPDLFSTPLLSDQTFRYHQTVTLRISFQDEIPNKLAYLCMFTSKELEPVGWGVINTQRKEIVFEQVPLNLLFIPVYYDSDMMVQASQAFMLQSLDVQKSIPHSLTTNKQSEVIDLSLINGKLYHTSNMKEVQDINYIPLVCDTTQQVNMRLYRKYPEKKRLKEYSHSLKGAIFTASNHKRKRELFDTLFTLNHIPRPYLQEISLHNKEKYRYYHFMCKDKERVHIAHMEFLGEYSSEYVCVPPTPLPILPENDTLSTTKRKLYRIQGTPITYRTPTEAAFDGNFETYVNSFIIGMDFKKPVNITHVRFIPRNANNTIIKGNGYLLMYYDGNKWKEFKTLRAEKNYLDFTNVPKATLYLLRNLTAGKEELPFFYQNEKQYFLHIDTLKKIQ